MQYPEFVHNYCFPQLVADLEKVFPGGDLSYYGAMSQHELYVTEGIMHRTNQLSPKGSILAGAIGRLVGTFEANNADTQLADFLLTTRLATQAQEARFVVISAANLDERIWAVNMLTAKVTNGRGDILRNPSDIGQVKSLQERIATFLPEPN